MRHNGLDHLLTIFAFERDRRQAAAQAERDAVVDQFVRQHVEMAQRLASSPRPGELELAEQLATAENWEQVDELRRGRDLSPAECVAWVMVIDFEAGMRLLEDLCTSRD